MENLYQRLKKEFEAMTPVPSTVGGYDSSMYKGNEELAKVYEAGYWDGLDGVTGRWYPGDSAPAERRKAYMYGLFTGSDEFWNDFGE